MVTVETYSLAVILCFVTMLCWGSWANTQKLAAKEWKFQLFYWDYAIGVFLLSLIGALTLGSFGTQGQSFFENLSQAEGKNLLLPVIGGIIFNLSNILLVGAIAVAGMAVAFPVGVGLALVLGVITNYMGSPVGNAALLFTGVLCIIVAIVLDALAYKRLSGQDRKTPVKGMVLSVLAGVLMGFFYRFVAASMSEDFAQISQGMLTPYSAVFLFSAGVLLSNFLWNSIVMAKPFTGQPATYNEYFTKGSLRLHAVGILGGMIWCVGMSLSIIASGSAGFAVSYGLGQGATMVAAFWGVFIWREFRTAPKGTDLLLTLMFIFFIVGLGLIIVSRLNS
jgi:glucose uptake protein